MLSALQKSARKQMVKRLEGNNIAGKIGNMKLERSRELFEKLTIDSAFMTDHPPHTWSDLAEYKNAQGTVTSLRVVNDAKIRFTDTDQR